MIYLLSNGILTHDKNTLSFCEMIVHKFLKWQNYEDNYIHKYVKYVTLYVIDTKLELLYSLHICQWL